MPGIRYPSGPIALIGVIPSAQSADAPVTAHLRIGIDVLVVTYSNGQYEHKIQRPPRNRSLNQNHIRVIARDKPYLMLQDDIEQEASKLLSLLPGSTTKHAAPAVRELFKGLDLRTVKIIIEYFSKSTVNTATYTRVNEHYDADLQFEALQAAQELEIRGLSRLLSLEIKATQTRCLFSSEHVSRMIKKPEVFNVFLAKWTFVVLDDEEEDIQKHDIIRTVILQLPKYRNLLKSRAQRLKNDDVKCSVHKTLLSAGTSASLDMAGQSWTWSATGDLSGSDFVEHSQQARETSEEVDSSSDSPEAAKSPSSTPTPAPKKPKLKLNPPKADTARPEASAKKHATRGGANTKAAEAQPAKLVASKKPAVTNKKTAPTKKRAASEEQVQDATAPANKAKKAGQGKATKGKQGKKK